MTAKTPTTHVIAVSASRVAATRAVVEAARVLRKERIIDSYVSYCSYISCCVAWDALDRALEDLDAVS